MTLDDLEGQNLDNIYNIHLCHVCGSHSLFKVNVSLVYYAISANEKKNFNGGIQERFNSRINVDLDHHVLKRYDDLRSNLI